MCVVVFSYTPSGTYVVFHNTSILIEKKTAAVLASDIGVGLGEGRNGRLGNVVEFGR